MPPRVVERVVHAHDQRDVLVAGGGGDQHLACPGLQVLAGLVPVGEAPGRLDHHVDIEGVPGAEQRVRLVGDPDGPPVHHKMAVIADDLTVVAPEHRVVLEQVGAELGVGPTRVHRHHVDVGVPPGDLAEHLAADPAESVDGDPDRHATPSRRPSRTPRSHRRREGGGRGG
jgi:hypothetical protein